MEHTGIDAIYSEGEETGWGGHPGPGYHTEPGHERVLIPPDMHLAKTREEVLRGYANSDLFDVYASYMCLSALLCGLNMADAMGDADYAKRWRAYAERIKYGMLRKLAIGSHRFRHWKISPYIVYSSFQSNLAPLWAAFYTEGLDPLELDPVMANVSRNSYIEQRGFAHGLAPVLGFGYGMGWMAKAGIMLDEMDDIVPIP